MPALGTHVIHAQRCLPEIKTELALDRDFLGAAAISHDTMALLPGYFGCFNDAHDKNTDDYFLALIQYIKDEGLRETPNAMAFLYGQLMHYALDTKTHPLIYYMTECHPAKFFVPALGAHTLFEAWYDACMEGQERAREGEAWNPRYCFAKKVADGGIDPMIDAVYAAVYGLKDAAKGYRNGIGVWDIYQSRLRGAMLRHVKKYHGDFEWMRNAGGAHFLHPVTNEPMSTSFEQAYESSIPLACELVEAVNANIYGGAANEEALRAALGNSYDTGVDWRTAEPKRYFLGWK